MSHYQSQQLRLTIAGWPLPSQHWRHFTSGSVEHTNMRRLCVSLDTVRVYFVSVLWPGKKASWQSEEILPVYRHNRRCNWPKGKEVVLNKGFLSGAVLVVLLFFILSGLFSESYESFGAAIRVLLVWNIQSFWILRILILSGDYMHTHTHTIILFPLPKTL